MNMKTNYPTLVTARQPERSSGFTLSDLAIVLAMVALLATLGLSARAGSKDQSLIAQCAGNLRQFALALQIYGNEYNDQLPNNPGGASPMRLPWDVGSMLVEYLAGPGSTPSAAWHTFYCPGRGFLFTESDNYRFWNYRTNQYRVLGYTVTFPGTPSLIATNLNATLTPQPIQYILSVIPASSASVRVLLADSTMSQAGQNNPDLKYTYNWTDVVGGYSTNQTSAHLEGPVPMGGNVAMLDGHVEWRKFSPMIPRTNESFPTYAVWWW